MVAFEARIEGYRRDQTRWLRELDKIVDRVTDDLIQLGVESEPEVLQGLRQKAEEYRVIVEGGSGDGGLAGQIRARLETLQTLQQKLVDLADADLGPAGKTITEAAEAKAQEAANKAAAAARAEELRVGRERTAREGKLPPDPQGAVGGVRSNGHAIRWAESSGRKYLELTPAQAEFVAEGREVPGAFAAVNAMGKHDLKYFDVAPTSKSHLRAFVAYVMWFNQTEWEMLPLRKNGDTFLAEDVELWRTWIRAWLRSRTIVYWHLRGQVRDVLPTIELFEGQRVREKSRDPLTTWTSLPTRTANGMSQDAYELFVTLVTEELKTDLE